MTHFDRIETEALQALAARGNIAPDRAINMGTLEAANAASALAAEVLELRARVAAAEKLSEALEIFAPEYGISDDPIQAALVAFRATSPEARA